MKANVKFRQSSVPGKAGTIYYQLTHLGKTRQIPTGIRLFSEQWDAAEQRIISRAPDSIAADSSLQRRVESDVTLLRQIIRDLNNSGKPYTTKDVTDLFYSQPQGITILTFMQEQIARLVNANKLGTARNYTRTFNSFSTFLGNIDLPFSAFTERLVEDYNTYLERRRVVRNTISFYMRILRSIYNRAVRQRIIVQNAPFGNVYTGVDRTRKRAVDEQVIYRLSRLDLHDSEALTLARDLFIFSYYTRGMSFVDIAYLRKDNVHDSTIRYTRRKTGQQLFIRLEPCMKKIIDRYENQTQRSVYVFPVLTAEESSKAYSQYLNALNYYNRLLKRLTSQLKIDSPLSSYTSRHSWATVARKHNVPLSIISAGMGHTSERTTQIYLALLENTAIDTANQLIIDSVNRAVSG